MFSIKKKHKIMSFILGCQYFCISCTCVHVYPGLKQIVTLALQGLTSVYCWDLFLSPSGVRGCHNRNIRGSQSEMAGHKFNMVISCIVLCRYFKKDSSGLCCWNGEKDTERERKEDHYKAKVFWFFCGVFAFKKRLWGKLCHQTYFTVVML